jgi:hypothetical protein
MGLSLTSDPQSFAQGLGNPSTTAKHTLGTKAVDGFGNVYRYVLAGVAPLVAGNWLQAPAQVALHQNMAPIGGTTYDVGATSLTVVLGATAAAASSMPAAGPSSLAVRARSSSIGASHPAALASALSNSRSASRLTSSWSWRRARWIWSPISTAASSRTPSTLTGACVGVATGATPAGQYDWIQTRGVGAALIAGTPGVGLAIVVPGTAAGAAVIDGRRRTNRRRWSSPGWWPHQAVKIAID